MTVGREGDDVVLTIGDDGRGFDLAEARRRQGLGLISLRHSLNGPPSLRMQI